MSIKVFAYQGTLVKTIGDEIMCTFPSAEAAMHGACAKQTALDEERSVNIHPKHIRIGFHYGDVICETGDVLRDTVNVAARVASATRASQIMATLAAVEMLPADLRDKTHPIFAQNSKASRNNSMFCRLSGNLTT